MLHDISHDKPADADLNAPAAGAPADGEQLARQQAIRQIERRRRFRIRAAAGTAGMILLVAIWATSEYQNAGGWPTHGFSRSSGIHNVWNFWIIYPLIAWVLYIAVRLELPGLRLKGALDPPPIGMAADRAP